MTPGWKLETQVSTITLNQTLQDGKYNSKTLKCWTIVSGTVQQKLYLTHSMRVWAFPIKNSSSLSYTLSLLIIPLIVITFLVLASSSQVAIWKRIIYQHWKFNSEILIHSVFLHLIILWIWRVTRYTVFSRSRELIETMSKLARSF